MINKKVIAIIIILALSITGCRYEKTERNMFLDKIALSRSINGEGTYAYAKVYDGEGELFVKYSVEGEITHETIEDVKSVASGAWAIAFVKNDGTVAIKDWMDGANNTYEDWEDIEQVCFVGLDVCGLKTDGNILVKSREKNQEVGDAANEASKWENIKYIGSDTGISIFGITNDGNILVDSYRVTELQNQMKTWNDIEYLCSSLFLAIAINYEGQIVYAEDVVITQDMSEKLEELKDAEKIVLGKYCIAGLTEEGILKVVPYKVYSDEFQQYNNLENVEDIFGNTSSIVILKKDGTVILAGMDYE